MITIIKNTRGQDTPARKIEKLFAVLIKLKESDISLTNKNEDIFNIVKERIMYINKFFGEKRLREDGNLRYRQAMKIAKQNSQFIRKFFSKEISLIVNDLKQDYITEKNFIIRNYQGIDSLEKLISLDNNTLKALSFINTIRSHKLKTMDIIENDKKLILKELAALSTSHKLNDSLDYYLKKNSFVTNSALTIIKNIVFEYNHYVALQEKSNYTYEHTIQDTLITDHTSCR
jgi:hypothetical protein